MNIFILDMPLARGGACVNSSNGDLWLNTPCTPYHSVVDEESGRTALHQAADQLNVPMVRNLIDSGALVSARDRLRNTPLHLALDSRFKESAPRRDYVLACVQALVSARADINAANGRGEGALHLAAELHDSAVVRALVDQPFTPRPDLNSRDNRGQTPLHRACAAGRLDVVQYLLGKGASVVLKDIHGQFPADAARRAGHREVLQFLVTANHQPTVTPARKAEGPSWGAPGPGRGHPDPEEEGEEEEDGWTPAPRGRAAGVETQRTQLHPLPTIRLPTSSIKDRVAAAQQLAQREQHQHEQMQPEQKVRACVCTCSWRLLSWPEPLGLQVDALSLEDLLVQIGELRAATSPRRPTSHDQQQQQQQQQQGGSSPGAARRLSFPRGEALDAAAEDQPVEVSSWLNESAIDQVAQAVQATPGAESTQRLRDSIRRLEQAVTERRRPAAGEDARQVVAHLTEALRQEKSPAKQPQREDGVEEPASQHPQQQEDGRPEPLLSSTRVLRGLRDAQASAAAAAPARSSLPEAVSRHEPPPTARASGRLAAEPPLDEEVDAPVLSAHRAFVSERESGQAELRAQMAKLERQMFTARLAAEEARPRIEALEGEVASLRSALAASEQESVRCKELLRMMAQKRREAEDALAAEQAARKALEQRADQRLEEQAAAERTERQRLEDRAAELEAEVASLRQANGNYKRGAEELLGHLETLEAELRRIRSIESDNGRLREEAAQLGRLNERLARENGYLKQRCESIEAARSRAAEEPMPKAPTSSRAPVQAPAVLPLSPPEQEEAAAAERPAPSGTAAAPPAFDRTSSGSISDSFLRAKSLEGPLDSPTRPQATWTIESTPPSFSIPTTATPISDLGVEDVTPGSPTLESIIQRGRAMVSSRRLACCSLVARR